MHSTHVELACLLIALLAASCGPSAPSPAKTIFIPHPGAQGAGEPPPEAETPILREGVILDKQKHVQLHAIDGALFVTAADSGDETEERQLYLAQDDRLVIQPGHSLKGALVNEGLSIAGKFPEHIYAIATSRDDTGFTMRVLERADSGWLELKLAETPYEVVYWSGGLVGLVRQPALKQKLVRLHPPGPEIPLPKGENPACGDFYTTRAKGFPKLDVQPSGLASAAGQLFVLGFGCDGNVAAAAWEAGGANAPRIHSIEEKAYFDGVWGTVLGRAPGDLWYMAPPMRPMAFAALFHFDGARWERVAWPSEDPQVNSVDADAGGALWAAIDGKLYRRKDGRWSQRPLSPRCEAQSVAVGGGDSVWVGCTEAVARVSGRAR